MTLIVWTLLTLMAVELAVRSLPRRESGCL
jgi:hypothetical protein